MSLLLNGAQDMEKAEILNVLFDSDLLTPLNLELLFFIYNKYKSIIKDSTTLTCLKSKVAQGMSQINL